MPTPTEEQNPNSAAPTTAGSRNGAVSVAPNGPLTRSVLASALERMDEPESDPTNLPPQLPGPERAEPATATEVPAQTASAEDLTAPETPSAESEPETPATGAPNENPTSQPDEISQLPQDVRALVTEMAREIASGKTTIGELKRGHKLAREFQSKMEAMQEQIEQLKAQPQPAADPEPTDLNPITNVKDGATLRKVKRETHELLEFAEENPEGGTFQGKEFDAAQVRDLRRQARRALDIWIPERAEQLARSTAIRQQQTQARQLTVQDFPYLNDGEHQDTKVARQLLAAEPALAGRVNADYLALCIARGNRELQSDLAKRKAGGLPANSSAPINGNGRPAAPKGRMVTPAGGSAAPRITAQQSVAQAVQRAKKEGSREALANVFRTASAGSERR